jgi:hypothetical protein
MQRIRHTTLAFGLGATGYWLRATAFGADERIRHLELSELTWRELAQMLEDLTDNWRPGVELLQGGTQDSLWL